MSKAKRHARNSSHTIPTGWTDTLLICRKCSRKLNGGFGDDGKQTLRQMLREMLRKNGRRGQVGLIETRCLGICPKQAVTAMRSTDPTRFHVVAAGTQPTDLI